MKEKRCICSDEILNMRLRSTEQMDIEMLRTWKNKNRDRFFFKEIISAGQQIKWFEQYLLREEDSIFIVEIRDSDQWKRIGCLGYRKLEDTVDLYNIIRGEKTEEKSSMKEAMKLLLAYVTKKYACPIKCDVLIDNPAVEWYNRCGFVIKEQIDDFYIMMFERQKIQLPNIEGGEA